jgi:hypothetical protein
VFSSAKTFSRRKHKSRHDLIIQSGWLITLAAVSFYIAVISFCIAAKIAA